MFENFVSCSEDVFIFHKPGSVFKKNNSLSLSSLYLSFSFSPWHTMIPLTLVSLVWLFCVMLTFKLSKLLTSAYLGFM